jgi:hypothetical protein
MKSYLKFVVKERYKLADDKNSMERWWIASGPAMERDVDLWQGNT